MKVFFSNSDLFRVQFVCVTAFRVRTFDFEVLILAFFSLVWFDNDWLDKFSKTVVINFGKTAVIDRKNEDWLNWTNK